jgi:hypothetical protein
MISFPLPRNTISRAIFRYMEFRFCAFWTNRVIFYHWFKRS